MGNVITFAQDIGTLARRIPRHPDSLGMTIVRRPNGRDPAILKYFKVCKARVLNALRYLKSHNPYYRDIEVEV